MNRQYEIALSFATEQQELVEKVYHYLKAEGVSVFFAPSPECQMVLSGKNQREIFYEIFGERAEYVALFVSKDYIGKEVPMEEASIAFAKHGGDGRVIPIYLDEAVLPKEMFNPKSTNYFKSGNPAGIASHLAGKVKAEGSLQKEAPVSKGAEATVKHVMNINGNTSEKQIFIQTLGGNIQL